MARTKRAQKPYHHGDLRRSLIEAAIELIAEQGVSGLSLRECARRAGVSHAAPYRHFEDKEALLYAIAEQGFEMLYRAGLEAIEAHDSPKHRLDAYAVAYVRFAFENPVLAKVMFTHPFDKSAKQQADAQRPDRLGGRAFDLLQQTASELVGEGHDPRTAAFSAWVVPHGVSMLVLDGRVPDEFLADSDTVEDLARAVLAMWRGPLNPTS